MPKKKLSVSAGRGFFTLLIPLALLTVVLLMLVFYQSGAVARNREVVFQTLSDSATEQQHTLLATLEGEADVLAALARSLASETTLDFHNVEGRMKAIADGSPFSTIGYVTMNGYGVSSTGRNIKVKDTGFFRACMAGQRAFSRQDSGLSAGKDDRFVIAVPVLSAPEKADGMVLGTLTEESLQNLLVSHAFAQSGYSFVADGTGEIIIRSCEAEETAESGNIFKIFEESELGRGYSASAVKEDLVSGRSGVVGYRHEGSARYAVYMPLGVNDWALFNVVSAQVADRTVTKTLVSGYAVIGCVFIACVLCLVSILHTNKKHAKKLELEREQLRVVNEEYRIAASQTGKRLYRYNIKTHLLEPQSDNAIRDFQRLPREQRENLLDAGIVAEESQADAQAFFEAIRRGDDCGTATLRLSMPGIAPGWYRADFFMVCDLDGKPLHALVTLDNVNDLHEKELAYLKWHESISARPNETIVDYEFNLTRDMCEREEGRREFRLVGRVEPSLTAFARYGAAHFTYPEDVAAYTAFLNRQRLLASFFGGTREESLTYRILNANAPDGFSYVRIQAQMIQDPYSTDVRLYLIFLDVDSDWREELRLTAEWSEDPLTKLLNRRALEAEMEKLLASSPPGTQHAFIMLDLDGFKKINDSLGHLTGDRLLIQIANDLPTLLRQGDLIGRLGGDEFVICLKSIPFGDVIEKRAQLIVDLLRRDITPALSISGSLGIALCPRDGADFKTLYHKADAALYRAKRSGRNRYVMFDAEIDVAPSDDGGTPIDSVSLSPDDLVRAREIAKRNETLLVRQNDEERYRLIMEHMGSIVFEWNLSKGSFSCADDYAAYLLSGYGSGALFSCPESFAAVHEDDLPIYRENICSPLAGGKGYTEATLRLMKKDGSFDWCRLTVLALRDPAGSLVRVIGMINLVDFAHGNASIQLLALTNYMAGGILLIEAGENVQTLYVSPSYSAVTGFSAESLAVPGDIFEKTVLSSEIPALAEAITAGARRGRVIDHVYRGYFASGALGWWHLRAVRIPYEASENPVLIAVVTDVTKLKEQEQSLKYNEERFRAAFEQTGASIWELNLKTRVFTESPAAREHFGHETLVFDDMPAAFLARGLVHPDCEREFTELFERMYAGDAHGASVLRIRQADGNFVWIRAAFKVLFSDDCEPLRAVGIMEPLPNIDAEKARFDQEQTLMRVLSPLALGTVRVNVRSGEVELYYAQDEDNALSSGSLPYREYYETLLSRVADDEDRLLLKSKLSLPSITAGFASGNRMIQTEFRRRIHTGHIRWAALTMYLVREPVSGDLYAFGYLRDVDQRRKWELSLVSRIERDITVNLYTRETTAALINSLLASPEEARALTSMALVEVHGLERIRSEYGAGAAAGALGTLCRLFVMLVDAHTVIGRIDENCFVFFRPCCQTLDEAKQNADNAVKEIARLSETVTLSGMLSCSIGVSVERTGLVDFERLYGFALLAARDAKEDEHNRFSVRMRALTLDERAANARVLPEMPPPAPGTLPDSELLFALCGCQAALLGDTSVGIAVRQALMRTAAYYGAGSVFLAGLAADGEHFSSVLDYTAEGRSPLARQIPGRTLPRFPFLQKVIASKRPCIFGGKGYDGSAGDAILAAPVMDRDRVAGVLCVSGPTLHADDPALLIQLAPLLISAQTRTSALVSSASAVDALTGLGTRQAYTLALASLSPDALLSLGVLFADVNGLSKLNRDYGSEYGDELLKFIGNMLLEQFPNEAYRISGDEFVVLARDVTHEAFLQSCDTFRSYCEFSYPSGISTGCTWSARDISPIKLVENAEKLLLLSKRVENADSLDPAARQRRGEQLKQLQNLILQKRFLVYLQPKISLKTGRLAGAEALARCMDPERGLLTPDKFIPVYEKEDIIRYLDLHMLEKTAELLARWRAAGRPVLPVSVNFSRATLFHPNSLSTSLAALKRYQVDPSLIEIEITESVGSLERATLLRICKQFSEAGFALALDDFGSEYSSLYMLSALHFDTIKLDKSLIQDLTVNSVTRAVVKSVIEVCGQSGAACVAEGVETAEQAEALTAFKCDAAQGYYYNKPLPETEFENFYFRDGAKD